MSKRDNKRYNDKDRKGAPKRAGKNRRDYGTDYEPAGRGGRKSNGTSTSSRGTRSMSASGRKPKESRVRPARILGFDLNEDLAAANARHEMGNDGLEVVAGRNPVTEALRSGANIDTIYICGSGGSLELIRRLAKEKDIVVKDTQDKKLSQLSGGASHQGVVAVGACAEYVSLSDILQVSKNKGTQPFIIICDEIEDPHNLGAIIRTAETAGADGIIIPKRRSASLNATVYKTSAGAVSYVPVARVTNLAAAIDELKDNGVWIYGTDASGTSYTSTDFTGSCALVIGSEGFGISRLIQKKCDFMVKLPMLGKINSLNASVAAGIFMYEVLRQRSASNN